MKKTIALVLAIIMCMGLVACGKPLAKECANISEAVEILTANYEDPAKDNAVIRENESVVKYFTKDYIDDEIWRDLMAATDEEGNAALSLSEIHIIYNVCNSVNGFDDWFEFINISIDGRDCPFIMYGDSGMDIAEVEDIVGESVENAWVCFALPEGAEAGFKEFEEGCRYKMLVEAGGEIYAVEGDVSWSGWTRSCDKTGLHDSLLTMPADQEGYSTWTRII